MSDPRQAVADYLAIRRALGFQLRGYDRLLGDLVDELQRTEASTLTTELAVAWATKPAGDGLSRYSLRNQWLIACECHARRITPTYVAGFRAFLALHRCVRKGETAIKILAPVAVKERDDTGDERARSGSSSAPCPSSKSP
jgi:hypothetical protein